MSDVINAAGIIREPTESEKQDFIPLTGGVPGRKERAKASDMQHSLSHGYNRAILTQTSNPLSEKVLKALICTNCFFVESINNVIKPDFDAAISKYKGRLIFDRISVDEKLSKLGVPIHGTTMHFHCEHCGKQTMFGFAPYNLKPESMEILKTAFNKSTIGRVVEWKD